MTTDQLLLHPFTVRLEQLPGCLPVRVLWQFPLAWDEESMLVATLWVQTESWS